MSVTLEFRNDRLGGTDDGVATLLCCDSASVSYCRVSCHFGMRLTPSCVRVRVSSYVSIEHIAVVCLNAACSKLEWCQYA